MATSPDAGAFARLRAAVVARVLAIRAWRLQLHANWRQLLTRAWSVRLAILAAALSGLEVVFGLFTSEPPLSREAMATLGFVLTVAAAIARLCAQSNVTSGDDA